MYAYYRDDKRKRIEASEQKPQSIEDDADFERVFKINEDWNREVAKIREARLTKERREMKEQIERNLEEQLEWEEEQRRITNELVLREKVNVEICLFDLAVETFAVSCCPYKICFQLKGSTNNYSIVNSQEAAKSFIVRENFDEALDAALEKKSNFNYAIDRDGKIIPGREYVNINKINQ